MTDRKFTAPEVDSCAVIAMVNKNAIPTHSNIIRVIEGLHMMGHRSGEINGEGDGCGIMTDIPQEFWAAELEKDGKLSSLARDERFFLGHFFIHVSERKNSKKIAGQVKKIFQEQKLDILCERFEQVKTTELGPIGASMEPVFWQVAGYSQEYQHTNLEQKLYRIKLQIEKDFKIHACSLSSYQANYKVRGTASVLSNYYNDLKSERFKSISTVGHSRYSTNTFSVFERVQPFSILAHNGEINTIKQLRREAKMLGVVLPDNGSDSQDVDRTLNTFLDEFDLSLAAAMEMMFPPIVPEMKKLESTILPLYRFFRQFWGPFAQGPAAIISRYRKDVVASVDAMGLRPLWLLESGDSYVLSSEPGVIPFQYLMSEPKPLAPGEKVMISMGDRKSKLLDHQAIQKEVKESFYKLRPDFKITTHPAIDPITFKKPREAQMHPEEFDKERELYGWSKEDVEHVRYIAENNKEKVGSLGHGGPLAALAEKVPNVADFFKENVAVVTNPAVDREREKEHFSTRTIIGSRPDLLTSQVDRKIELKVPLVLHVEKNKLVDDVTLNAIALRTQTICWRSLISQKNLFHGVGMISAVFKEGETLRERMEAIKEEVIASVRKGCELIVLDDSAGTKDGFYPIDPVVLTIYIDTALRRVDRKDTTISKRRSTSLIVKSKAIRNLHDVALLLGLGANAVAPTMMLETILETAEDNADAEKKIESFISGLSVGIEKVISTMGIHELRGYLRLFSSIGLSEELAKIFKTGNFCGGENSGLTIEKLEASTRERKAGLKGKISLERQINSRIWKKLVGAAEGTNTFKEAEQAIDKIEKATPLSIRHCFDIKALSKKKVQPKEVDLSIDTAELPFLIAAMSFGAQSEGAFYSYAEAAKELNMVCLNGEGGEPAHMLGNYYEHRSQQIASGRFGVNIALLNSARFLEIKVGQGAKPGEGGMLPGNKVSEKIAKSRHTSVGIDLISPSNNHDIYSIEDLAQVIQELKTANPQARISVKVPVVEGIGTIALAVAKAGADIINISGFDGGTGAARLHAIKYVGLPAEIGVFHAHEVLVEEGLRDDVEIWVDGGIRRAADVLKMVALGANRVGFGTLPMMGLGCTACRDCHLNTCHVGISTQITTAEEAADAGIKKFRPLDPKQGIENLKRLFNGLADELRELCAERGIERLQDIVGNTDLIEQFTKHDSLDITGNVQRVKEKELSIRKIKEVNIVRLRRPQNQLTRDITNLFSPQLLKGKQNIVFEESNCNSSDRAIVTDLAGYIQREQTNGNVKKDLDCQLYFKGALVAGGGFAAYHHEGLRTVIEGASQDGACKSSHGGDVYILKGLTSNGLRVGGSVGKCFAYGAQKGFFVVQGEADSRACIRMSGADVVFSAPMKQPVNPTGHELDNATLKGFAFEYMTSGRVIVLGDPGLWICGGMSGGVVYIMLQPAMGLDRETIAKRLSESSMATVQDIEAKDEGNILELLEKYRNVARKYNQADEVKRIDDILSLSLKSIFVKLAV